MQIIGHCSAKYKKMETNTLEVQFYIENPYDLNSIVDEEKVKLHTRYVNKKNQMSYILYQKTDQEHQKGKVQ